VEVSGVWEGILMPFYDRRKGKGVVRIVDKEKDFFFSFCGGYGGH
jgi:hypothetical protein